MRQRLKIQGGWMSLAAFLAVLIALPFAGCGDGQDGLPGADGADGMSPPSTGTISGTVTNALTGEAIADTEIGLVPDPIATAVMTDASGHFETTLPVGYYEVLCEVDDYLPHSHEVSILAGEETVMDIGLQPENRVVVRITGAPSPAPIEAPISLTAELDVFDGTTPVGYDWQQSNSVSATIGGATAVTATVTLPNVGAFMDELRDHVSAPERWDVLPVSPHALEEGIGVGIECTVTMSDGATYEGSVHLTADVPFAAWSAGLRNVPVGLPVILNGKTQDAFGYDWSLDTVPAGSAAALAPGGTVRNPWFVADVPGKYVLSVTDATDGPQQLILYAGNYSGGINGHVPGADTVPTTSCTDTCHVAVQRDKFDDWAQTGHAHIFSENINAGGHYSSGCFACHTVGFNPDVVNGGFDEAADYAAFTDHVFPGGHIHGDPGNWTWMLANAPEAAQKANIQCENCHGPNGTTSAAHAFGSALNPKPGEENPRIDVRSDVCGFCHGEPPRHARYQQWEESGHGNYEVAVDAAGCGQKCHTGQGYVAWSKGYKAWVDGGMNPAGMTWTSPGVSGDAVHPVTCVVCHDPHNVGTVSGAGNNAPMRVEDGYYDTEAGFDMTHVGKGAQCMTCHNGRRGLLNDSTGLPGSAPDRAPHGGPQSDVLFGQNAFFVTPGIRGDHSFLDDTCVTCHVELTPPPAELSYQLGGTNHSFEAKLTICADCHGLFDGGTLVDAFEDSLHDMKAAVEQALLDQIEQITSAGGFVEFNDGDLTDPTPHLVVTDIGDIVSLELIESHGRSAVLVFDGTTYFHCRLGSSGGTVVWHPDGSQRGSLVKNGMWFDSFGPSSDDPEVIIAKAAYNYFLLHSDGSHSIHNPTFAANVIANTLQQLNLLGWNLVP